MRYEETARPTGLSPSPFTAAVRAVATIVTRPVWTVADRIMAANERWRQRQALMSLDEHLLKDIGLSRSDAEHEAEKPFWR